MGGATCSYAPPVTYGRDQKESLPPLLAHAIRTSRLFPSANLLKGTTLSRNRLMLVLLLAIALIGASCGDDDSSDGDAETTTIEESGDDLGGGDDLGDDDLEGGNDLEGEDDTAGGEDSCDGVTLEATDTGVTADTITVFVMADAGFELAPGLFQGSIDGAKAWADKINAEGGLACREVELIEWDSALSPVETANGFLNACDTSVAMIGSTALATTDAKTIEDCGIADIPERSVVGAHACSPNVFLVAGENGSCPYSGSGPRDYELAMGGQQWILDNELSGAPVEGIFVIPSDLPQTVNATVPLAAGLNEIGVNTLPDGEFGMSGLAEQAQYGAIIQYMNANDVTWGGMGSNDQAMLKLRNEAAAQGFDDEGVAWVCQLACYTPQLIEQGGENVEGTYVYLPFLPHDETETNENLAAFIEAIGDPFPPSWAATSFASGLAFEEVVENIVATEGPNAVTREAILEGMPKLTDFSADGWLASANLADKSTNNCFVVVQVIDGEYVRRFPEERGTLGCEDTTTSIEDLDPEERYQG
jgi:hypothetical protein